jgi:peptidoglycan/xylan/chitin deacetylase (PgdA/CDA1 family)
LEEMKELAQVIPVDNDSPLSEGDHYVSLTFDDGFQSIIENVLPELIERGIPATIFIPTGYIGRKPDWIIDQSHEDCSEVVMTTEQIKGLPAELITIGSHTVRHSELKQIGEEILRRELIESRKKLQEITGREITLLSLPHGGYDDNVLELARQTGYQRVLSSLPRLTKKREYVVERVPVRPSDWTFEFRLKFLGAYRWLAFILGLKRRLSVSNTYRA